MTGQINFTLVGEASAVSPQNTGRARVRVRGVVLPGLGGIGLFPFGRGEHFSSAAARAAVLLAGCAIAFLGL